MRRPLRSAILWLGAVFIVWHVFTFLFSAHPSQPGHSTPDTQLASIKTSGDAQRAAAIVDAFRFSWDKYEKYAAPHDTLKPVTKTYEDDRNGWGATAIDGLSTAIIMNEAVIVNKILQQIAATDFTVTSVPDQPISLFETTIRYLGGLLSAYDLLSGPYKHLVKQPHLVKTLLEAAVTLADRLSIAFDTPSGIPDDEVIFNPQLRRYGNIDNSITCFGTLVLEWTRLSDLTGNQTYAALARKAEAHLIYPKTNQAFTLPGLVGTYVKLNNGYFGDYQAGWGGGSDSYYEYLIKMYAYDPISFAEYRDSWILAAESSMLHLASSPSTRPDLTFLGEMRGKILIPTSSHLASVCGGSLILGGLLLQNQTFIDFGLKLSKSYYEVYRQSPSGIGPELFRWVDDGRQPMTKPPANRPPSQKWASFYETSGFYPTNPEYILRPETIESLYYAYRATGDRKWQDWAWEAFESLNRMSRVEGGYTGLRSVMKKADDDTRQFIDKMESFWLAETLKYLYLIFAEDSDLHVRSDGRIKYVLNTEAHPLLFNAASVIEQAGTLLEACKQNCPYPSPSLRIGTVTAHFGEPQQQYQKALQTHLIHSLVHGTQLDVLCSPIIDAIWNKPAFILSLLLDEMVKAAEERLDWIFWADRDTLVLDPCRPVSSFLPPETRQQRSKEDRRAQKDLKDRPHLIISKDWNGLNAGVFLVRVDRWAIDFFSDLLAFRHFQPNVSLPFEEQSAMEILLDEPRYRQNVEEVPSVWFNAYPGDSPTEFMERKSEEGLEYYNARRGDFLLHFAGIEDKDQLVDEWADMLERQKGPWQPQQILRNITANVQRIWSDEGYYG
ncbi:hypothetical protein NM208_g2554 [Fusarium decemcellulare]|uniref:Uncharacterized protein n=2 Tax=Fusarium decemcellulare TaxID=57161 RepID=A0ACC1S6P8_9HYPO|nr:hypothetical protein NM208_g8063 [Fusarium decemcellulare]KAJ3545350.1 hypothetical protein NM208_g2554 [Fusarium decemcellulare]